MAQAISRVALLVRDYDEAIAFFTQRLRFDLVEDKNLGGGKRWVVVAPPGAGTALLLARATTPEQAARVGDQAGGRVFLILHTDDFWRDHREMTSRGVRFTEEPRREQYGTVAVFEDLYGNRWDLLQTEVVEMADELIARYRRWFEYERDAHDKVFASLDTVPADRRAGPEFGRAVAILAHVVAARRVWLGRFGALPPMAGPLFPDAPGLDQVRAEWRSVAESWDGYLSSLGDADIVREFEYQSLDAGRFRNRVEDILAQLYGHSWYHRGQIAMLVKAAGGTPAITDLVYWCREPVGGPAKG
jgi:uncharacterized damage-inducible protein DinB/predicted enzyme related to lactoylglutathione lyase